MGGIDVSETFLVKVDIKQTRKVHGHFLFKFNLYSHIHDKFVELYMYVSYGVFNVHLYGVKFSFPVILQNISEKQNSYNR